LSVFVKYFTCIFEGSPFRPKIICPSMVEVVDCLENWTAADRLLVGLDELYSIVFDCGGAGPGMHLFH